MGITPQRLRGGGSKRLLPQLAAARGTALVTTRDDFDRGLTILDADPAFYEILGRPQGQAVGVPLTTFLVEGEEKLPELQRTVTENGRGKLTARARTGDGNEVWLDFEVARTTDEQLVVVAHDVTEHHATERRLESALELLAMVATSSSVGVWQSDPESEVLDCNATMYELFGLDPREPLIRRNWLERIHPNDRAGLESAIEEGWRVSEITVRGFGPAGETRHLLVRGKPIRTGERETLVGIVVDVSEDRQATRRVIETLESITDAYFALDHDWRFTYVNAEAERVLSTRREELLGEDIREVLPEAVRSTINSYREALVEGRVSTFEWFYEAVRRWFEVRAYPLPDGAGVYFRDVTERHDAEAEMERLLEAEQEARLTAEMAQQALEYQATHDSLTNLLNRGELIEQIEQSLGNGKSVIVLFIDLDRFKLVNDSLGHATGDRMLEELAHRLAVLDTDDSLVARIGGDEFVIALTEADRTQSIEIAENVLDAVRDPVWVEGHSLNATASIGISDSNQHSTAEDLLRDADVALYRAKDIGGDRWMWFDEEARLDVLRRVSIERDLHEAILSDQLELHYQPAFILGDGGPANVESLLRWHHPERGMIPPAQFIPIAEESGLILPIGRWVLRQTLSESKPWMNDHGLKVWANVSIRQLLHPGLADLIELELEAAGIDPINFGIEITESVLADNDAVIRELDNIAQIGVSIAIDDFGTGYSSISRLSNLPVDVLKIDQSFVQEIEASGGIETVRAIVDLGHALDCLVIAEGTETEGQLDALVATGCDQAGGFLFCHPVPAPELIDILGNGRELLPRA